MEHNCASRHVPERAFNSIENAVNPYAKARAAIIDIAKEKNLGFSLRIYVKSEFDNFL